MSKTFLVMGLAAVALSFPVAVEAQVCTTDQDCGKGWICKASAVTSTAPARQCVDGKECAKVPEETSYTPPSYCEPRECQANTDCPEGMVCHGETSRSCKGGASIQKCPADVPDCKPTVIEQPTTCTDSTTYRCAYQWQLPCAASADCGAGFVCEPNTITTCRKSGIGGSTGSSGSTGPSSVSNTIGASDVTAPLPECETKTTFPGNCILEQSTCKVDTDCPASWTCKEMATIISPPKDLDIPVTQPDIDDRTRPSAGGAIAVGGANSSGGAVKMGGVMATGGAMAMGGAMSTGGTSSTGAIMAKDDIVPPTGGSVTGSEPDSTTQAGSPSSGSAPSVGATTSTGGSVSGSGGSSTGGGFPPIISDVKPIETISQMVCVSPLGIGYGWRGQTTMTATDTKGGVSSEGTTSSSNGPDISLPPTVAPPSSPDPTIGKTTNGSGEAAKTEAGGGCSLSQGSQGGLTGLFLLGFVGLFLSRWKTRR